MKGVFSNLPLCNDDGEYLAVIEVAAGSRNKFKFEPQWGAFVLHKLLPLGASFPYDFGFLPGTRGEDGDPLDILVFMDESVPVGSVVPCRIVGIIQAEQTEKEKAVRNDRLLAVACSSQRFAHYQGLSDITEDVLTQIEAFFAFYNRQEGKIFTPLDRGGRRKAEKAIERGAKAQQRKAKD
jgi:inorganic pyrophosphatase